MTFRLKLTHYHHSVHVLVSDLQASTVYARFQEEFPELMESPPVLRWLDADGDWIEIQPGIVKMFEEEVDFEIILKEQIVVKGIAHIQSGDIDGVYEPIQLSSLMTRQGEMVKVSSVKGLHGVIVLPNQNYYAF
ncbi:hypothetical protein BG006_002859 [Podila minutissima]|uniref:Uncharacterized protein n=1 Tax=Podila minutissima TaxID=64525 RepID=A0A9P5S9I3_9FUNG|nr:hypothetical protein BG006_002859 [Podila minutissima]